MTVREAPPAWRALCGAGLLAHLLCSLSRGSRAVSQELDCGELGHLLQAHRLTGRQTPARASGAGGTHSAGTPLQQASGGNSIWSKCL